jgi:arylsulfatase A-like enzyme
MVKAENNGRRYYGATICAIDDGVGEIMDTLKILRIEEKTLVFFLSDNGGAKESKCDNSPFKGLKAQLYEGGIHVPFLAQWRGTFPAGAVFDHPVITMDLFATAVGLANGKAPSDRPMDGINLAPYVLGQTQGAPHDFLFWRIGGGSAYAVRQGPWKLVLTLNKPGGQKELYNLEQDVGETRNLADSQPEVLQRLETARIQWNKQLIPPVFEGAYDKSAVTK